MIIAAQGSNIGPGGTTAGISLAGFAVQRFLEILDPFTTLCINGLGRRLPRLFPDQATTKRALTGLASFGVGVLIAKVTGLSLLQFITTQNARGWDLVLTGLVLSAGTEGANTALKYFAYLKDAKGDTTTSASAAGALTVLPPLVTLAPRQRLRFSAIDRSGRAVPASWATGGAGSGSVDSDGTYTAPEAKGAYSVVAIGGGSAELIGVASVTVE